MQLEQVIDAMGQRLEGISPTYLERWMRRHRPQLEAVIAANLPSEEGQRPNTSTLDLLTRYDAIVIAFSGGKDSLAATLHLLELLGGDRSRLELWHHLVDGDAGDLFDWPCTRAYCQAVADTLELPLYFSWRQGGFEGEMLRDNQPTGAVVTEMPDGTLARAGGSGPLGTRRRFPQVSSDLKVRWCSAALKIDPAASAIRLRWPAGRVLLVTGERRQESSSRARYARVERHKSTTLARRVDQWRPILDWSEREVWESIQAAGIVPHPAYGLGYSRLSCACCIFGGPDEWATFRQLRPVQWRRLVELEGTFDRTLRRNETIETATQRGRAFAAQDQAHRARLISQRYAGPIRVAPERWELPAGAFRHTAGPS